MGRGLGFFHRCALKRDGKGKCTYDGGCGACKVWAKKRKEAGEAFLKRNPWIKNMKGVGEHGKTDM